MFSAGSCCDLMQLLQGNFNVREHQMNLDMEKLEELLLESTRRISAIAGKTIILLGGITGSGKSTTINSLIDVPLIEHVDDETGKGTILIAPDHRGRSARIGGAGSETTYPDLYPIPDRADVSICDTAGFFESRGIEYEICVHFSLIAAIRAARKIQALLTVTDGHSLLGPEGRGMIATKIMNKIESLIGSHPGGMQESVFFGFNQSIDSRRSKTETQLRASLQQKYELYSDSRFPREQAAARAFNKMLACQIVPVLPLSRGRQMRLLERLTTAPGLEIDTSALNVFGEFQAHMVGFCTIIASRLLLKHNILSVKNTEITECSNQIQELSQYITNLTQEMANLQAQIDAPAQPDRAVETRLRNAIAKSENRITACENKIATLREKVDKLTQKNQRLKEAKHQYETDSTHLETASKEYDEEKLYGEVKKGVVHEDKHIITTRSAYPIADVDIDAIRGVSEGEEGKYEEISKENGKYTGKYTTPSHVYGRCKVTLYSEKRHTVENKHQAVLLDQEITHNEIKIHTTLPDNIRRKEADIEAAREDIENFEQLINDNAAEGRASKEAENASLRLIITSKQSELTRHSESRAQIDAKVRTLTDEVSTLQEQLGTNNSSFCMLLRFLLLIPEMCLSSETLRKFKELSETTYRAEIGDKVGHIRPIGETVAAATAGGGRLLQTAGVPQTVATATTGGGSFLQRAGIFQTVTGAATPESEIALPDPSSIPPNI